MAKGKTKTPKPKGSLDSATDLLNTLALYGRLLDLDNGLHNCQGSTYKEELNVHGKLSSLVATQSYIQNKSCEYIRAHAQMRMEKAELTQMRNDFKKVREIRNVFAHFNGCIEYDKAFKSACTEELITPSLLNYWKLIRDEIERVVSHWVFPKVKDERINFEAQWFLTLMDFLDSKKHLKGIR